MFTIPATNKLLPDPLPDYYDKPKFTLVFEMTDLLVHPEWSVRKTTCLSICLLQIMLLFSTVLGGGLKRGQMLTTFWNELERILK